MNPNETTAVATTVAETPSQRQRPTRGERGRKLPRLFRHASGHWAASIGGKRRYFGRGTEAEAMTLLIAELPVWLAGGNPRAKPAPEETPNSELTIRQLVNRYLTAKKKAVKQGLLTRRSFDDADEAMTRLMGVIDHNTKVTEFCKANTIFAKLRDSFERKGWGPWTMDNAINRTKAVFRWGYREGHLDYPAKFGEAFRPPSAKAKRAARNAKGPIMFEAHELLKLLADVSENRPVLEAMILLGVNAALGNTDVFSLKRSALDLDGAWLNFPRPKTEVPRRCKLWPETVDALRKVLKLKRKAASSTFKDLVFLTVKGQPYSGAYRKPKDKKPPEDDTRLPWRNDAVAVAFVSLLKKHQLKRRGLGFYALRKTFETIASRSLDQIAVDHVMGHVDTSMSAVYRQRVDDDRLVRVSNLVRDWLFAPLREGKADA